jgi:probable F420-dependent oxidoreductase
MEWGLVFTSTKCPEPDRAVALVTAAEEAGFTSVWAPEHIVIPAEYISEYGFSADGKIGLADRAMPDPLIWLTFVAAVTSRIRLGTGILLLPQHNPLILAKATSTLDVLSGGRFDLGIGPGWLREAFDALGVGFTDRGARTDECIEVLREVWTQSQASFDGEHYRFDRVRSYPKPTAGTVPIHVGGDSRAAARRAGRTGDGFFPAMWPTERVFRELPALLDVMRRSAREAGRDPARIHVTAGGATDAEEAKWFADQGVHQLTTTVKAKTPAGMREELLRFAERIIAPTIDL